ncbi:MAG: hypothetical protein HUK23_05220 [Sphaerochaetaceae bacterium]|nr:hypothetical protein [Sphaerochaetaceae bacterium]
MPSRYYFLSSLPMLRFSATAPMSWEAFLASAKGNVSNDEYNQLCDMANGIYGQDAFLQKWADFETGLKEAVNEQRRLKLGKGSENTLVFKEYEVDLVSNAVINEKNPLTAEMIMLQSKYDFLEREKGFDAFSRQALYSYALQLRLLIRKDCFTSEAGNSEFQRLFGILENEINMD